MSAGTTPGIMTPNSSSHAFFRPDLNDDVVRDLLQAARAGNSMIRSIEEAGDADQWIRDRLDSIGQRRGHRATPIADEILDPRTPIARLEEIKSDARRLHHETEHKLTSLAGYFFSIAAGLAHHDELLSSQGRDAVDCVLKDLSRIAPDPWRRLLRRAIHSKQRFQKTDVDFIEPRVSPRKTDRDELLRHAMSVYYEPLQAYYRATGFRSMGEAAELVTTFFESKLDTLFDKWLSRREQVEAYIPLRAWMMSSFHQFLRDERRRRQRADSRLQPLDEASEPKLCEDAPHVPRDEFERSLAKELVLRAVEKTREFCSSNGNPKQWEAFVSWHLRGVPYAQIAQELDVRQDYARRLVMDGRDNYKHVFASFLFGSGLPQERLSEELDDLLAILDRGTPRAPVRPPSR